MFQKRGIITYNGHKLDEFCVQRTSAYISQTDNHIAELTVRETLDYAARFQGASQGFAGLSKHFYFMYLTILFWLLMQMCVTAFLKSLILSLLRVSLSKQICCTIKLAEPCYILVLYIFL